MHKNIIIYTERNFTLPNKLSNVSDTLILKPDNSVTYIDNYSLEINNKTIYFDYLVTDDLNILEKANVIFDNEKVLVNNVFLSSIDNIYAFGETINTLFPVEKQLEIIINDILN